VLWRFRRVFFLLGLLLVAGVAGVGYVLANVPLPDAELPVETTFVYDADGNKLAELSAGENRVSIELEDVSPHLVHAVLATEDRDFFRHPGIDATAIARATLADLRGEPLQGGSTITQQYVKVVYTDRERTIVRKLKEATLAVKLERRFEKEEILERYLNIVYFGRGAYGVQAASQAYFGVDAGALDVAQAAYLAGLIRAPEQADAGRPDQAAEADRRRDVTLRAMEQEGYLTEPEVQWIASVPVASYVRDRDEVVRDRIVGSDIGTEYFVEYVRAQMARRYGDDRLNGGGLQIHTTLDLDLQRQAYEAVHGTLDQEGDPAGALVSLDGGGQVKAMVGGRSFAESSVNLAVGADGGGTGRQAGSTYKPFVLAELLREGYSVESALPSPAELTFPGVGEGGSDYVVRNFDGAAHGRINLVEATRVSSNTAYAQLAELLGPPAIARTAADLGVTSTIPGDRLGPSIALGSAEVSVLDMATAYLTFATRGTRVDPLVVTRVTDAEGREIDSFRARTERVLEPEHADVVNLALQEVVRSGTGRAAAFGRDLAGKTGTSQNSADAWFVGYTPGMVTAVWMGHPEGQVPMDSVHGVRVTGGSFPADIFRRYMSEATRDPRYAGTFVEAGDLGGRSLTGDRDAHVDPEATTTTVAPTTTVPTTTTTTTTTAPPPTTEPPPPPTTPPPTTAPPTTAPPPPPTTAPPAPPAPVAADDEGVEPAGEAAADDP
jgi:membrane peptidoglycan carboxypeptidase